MTKLVELNLRPDSETLRRFGWIALISFGLLAALAWNEAAMFRFGLGEARLWVVLGFIATSVLCGVFSLIYPKGNLPLYVGLSIAFFPIGLVVSHVLLATIFFLVIGPISLIMKVSGYDPLERGFDPGAKSYWIQSTKARTKASYFRQF